MRKPADKSEGRGDWEDWDWKTVLMCGLQTERHSYEKCQYDEFLKRVAKMDELRAAKGGDRSN